MSDPYVRSRLSHLLPYVGTVEALMALDATPLPDEPFDASAVSPGDHDLVAEVLRLTEAACETLLDREHATIARRIVARVARRDPRPLRRPEVERTAAALVWLTGRIASGEFCRRGRRQAIELWDRLRVPDCSGRGRTLLRAAGLDVSDARDAFSFAPRPLPVGDATVLHSSFRHRVVDERDHLVGLDRKYAGATWDDDGLHVRAAPKTPLVALKGTVDGTGRIGIVVGFDDGTAEGWYLALSTPEAHHLVALLQHAIEQPAPRSSGWALPC